MSKYTWKHPSTKSSNAKDPLLLRKNLSLTLLSPKFDLKNLSLPKHTLRKTFKYSFTKKIKQMTFESDVFPYYAPFLPDSLQKLTLKRNRFLVRKKPLKPNEKLTKRSLESFKHLKQLEITKEVFFSQIKAIRKISSLEHLSLAISEKSIPAFYSLFRGLSRLQTVELIIHQDRSSFSPWKPEKVHLSWRFFKDLINLKKLKTLRLNTQNCFINKEPGFFYRLLGMLNENTSLEELDLTLHLSNYEEDEQNEGALQILSQIEGLEIVSSQYSFLYYDFNKNKNFRKMIRLSFSPKDERDVLDIPKLFTKCLNLKSLKLQDYNGKMVISVDSQFAATLEVLKVNISERESKKILDLLRYLSNGSQSKEIKNFNLQFDHFTDDILKELIEINSLLSPDKVQKYSLSTQDIYPYLRGEFEEEEEEGKNYRSGPLNNKLFCCFVEGLSKFTSLKKLTLCTRIEEMSIIKSLETSLKELRDLTNLELKISGDQDEDIILDLPVEDLIKLQDLRLKFSFNFKFKDFLGFLEKLSKAQELEYLVIDCIDIDPRDKNMVKRISQTLDRFAICRRLYVNRDDEEDLSIQFIDAESESHGN